MLRDPNKTRHFVVLKRQHTNTQENKKKISEMKIGYLGDCRRRNIKKKTRRAGKFTHIECRQNWKLNPHTNTPLATRKNKHPHKHTSTQFHRGRERESNTRKKAMEKVITALLGGSQFPGWDRHNRVPPSLKDQVTRGRVWERVMGCTWHSGTTR